MESYKNHIEEAKCEWIRLSIQLKSSFGFETDFLRFNFNLTVKKKNLRIKLLELNLEDLKELYKYKLELQANKYKKIERKLLNEKNSGLQQTLMEIELKTQKEIDVFNAGLVELGAIGDIQKFLDFI